MDNIINCCSSFSPHSVLLCFVIFTFSKVVSATTVTLVNRCDNTIWPGTLASSGSTPLESTGFELSSGESRSFQLPPGWSGRFWARTGCNFDSNSGSCATGDCGSGQMQCNGAGAIPPATLAEFTIGSGSNQDYYDVSLVDGYNLPMVVDASGGSGSCQSTGCVADLNQQCPAELKADGGDACKSACGAFGTDEYCCNGAFGSPSACKSTVYSQMFKTLCPRAYSYAFDDATSTFTCMDADYRITFCPTLTSQKSSRDSSTMDPGSTVGYGSSGSGSGFSTGGGVGVSWLSNWFSGGTSSLTSQLNLAWQLTLTASVTGLLFVGPPS